MAFAGESTLVFTTAKGYDGTTPLTVSDVTSVTLSIWDSSHVNQINEVTMSWDSVREGWEYEWFTVGLPNGSYLAKVTFHGLNSTLSFNFLTIRLARDKTPA